MARIKGAIMDVGSPTSLSQQIFDRICSEYIEMPGLRLTDKQAQRLWGLGEETCCTALALLVEAGFLYKNKGMYQRLAEGAMASPRFRMARARLDPDAVALGS